MTRKKKLFRCAGCLVIVIICLFIMGVVALRVAINTQLTPEQRETLRTMQTEILQLPPDWHQPATPPPPEAIAYFPELRRLMDNLRETHDELLFGPPYDGPDILPEFGANAEQLTEDLRTGKISTEEYFEQLFFIPEDIQEDLARSEDVTTEPQGLFDRMAMADGPILTPDMQADYPALLNDLQHAIDVTSAAVTAPGFTMELDLYTTDIVNFLAVQVFAKLCAVEARRLAELGEYYQAIDIATLPLHVIRRPEHATYMNHTIGVAVSAIISGNIANFMNDCDDVRALEYALQKLTNLREVAFPGDITLWKYGNLINDLRHAAANGFPVDLSSQTMTSYIHGYFKLQEEDYLQWIVDNLPPDDPRVQGAQVRITANEYWSESQVYEESKPRSPRVYPMLKLFIGYDYPTLYYLKQSARFNLEEPRSFVALTVYDLTRQDIRRRIADLRGEPPPEPLTDPISGKPFLYSEALGRHYGTGPDKKDDRTEIQYDATNGTISPGDVFYRPIFE